MRDIIFTPIDFVYSADRQRKDINIALININCEDLGIKTQVGGCEKIVSLMETLKHSSIVFRVVHAVLQPNKFYTTVILNLEMYVYEDSIEKVVSDYE